MRTSVNGQKLVRSLMLCLGLLSLIVIYLTSTPVSACGPDSDCVIGDRFYRIRMPESHNGSTHIGAIIFAHGYRGSAQSVMRNESLAKVASRLGVALVAVKSSGDDWSIPGAPSGSQVAGADELAYFDAVRADMTSRFPIDADRLMVTGFSAGGMMVWNLICHRSGDFAAFAPIAGTFWEPVPKSCEGPTANIVHLHGTADRIVPLEGRPIQDTKQGAVREALSMYARFGGFVSGDRRTLAGLDCQDWGASSGALMRFCTFEGGHSFRSLFVETLWQMFEDAGVLSTTAASQ